MPLLTTAKRAQTMVRYLAAMPFGKLTLTAALNNMDQMSQSARKKENRCPLGGWLWRLYL